MYRISPPEKFFSASLLFPLRNIQANFALFTMLLRNDLCAKFRHSILGVLWLFIPPLSILLIYIFVFNSVFKMRWPEDNFSSRWGMGLMIFAGITVYSAFSDSVMGSLHLLTSRAGMLKRTPFPYELLPVSFVCSNMIVSAVMLYLVFFFSLATGGYGSWLALIYFPLIYLPFALFTAGVCWSIAALGVFFRDLGNLLGILLLLLFFGSPVFYHIGMVPEPLNILVRFNPLTPAIRNIRFIFLQNGVPGIRGLLYLWIAGVFAFHAGFWFFQRLRRRFADVV